MPDDDLEIIIEDDPIPGTEEFLADTGAKAPAAEPQRRAVSPEEGAEALRTQLAAKDAEIAAANARANAAARAEAAARGEVQDTNVTMVETTIAAVKQDIAAMEAGLADAWAAGDFSAAAKLQSQISRKAAEQLQLETGLESLKAAPKPTPTAPAPVNDPVEQMARQLTDPSAAWIRAHPDFARDPVKQRRLLAAHNLAETDGYALDSAEYFAAVERTLKIGSSDGRPDPTPAPRLRQEQVLSDTSKPAGGRTETQPASLPPSRGGNGDGSSTTKVVRLTREQVEAASISGMTTQEYARELQRLEKDRREGRIQ
jgi:hypothetical protein